MQCLPYPGSKSDVLDGGVVWKLWGRIKHRSRRGFPRQTFFPQPLPIFMKCLLSAFMLRDRFFCLAASESFPLSSREAGIGAFLVAAHFSFAFSISLQPARNRQVMQQPIFDGLVAVSAVARELVFVFYLHRERCGLFVRLSQLLRKRAPFPNNLVPGIHLVHFGFTSATWRGFRIPAGETLTEDFT